jgi:hypothetical protein
MRTQTGTYRTYKDMLTALPKIGKLQVVELSHKNKWGAYYIKCQCECGNTTNTSFSSLNKFKAQSCGCLQREAVKHTGTKNKKYTIDVDKLIDNDITAYIAGIYAADGSNEKSGISIGLQSIDKKILEKISNYFNYTGPLYTMKKPGINDQDHVRLTISDHSFRKFFEARGIVKNKTLNYQVPDLYLYNSHFWRGMIDGDGCIFKYQKQYTTYGVSLVGTKHTIDSFKKYCEFILGKSVKVKSYKIKSTIDVYSINFVGKMYLPLLNAIYGNIMANMHITRKYNKYLEIINI